MSADDHDTRLDALLSAAVGELDGHVLGSARRTGPDFETFHRATASRALARAMLLLLDADEAERAAADAYKTLLRRWTSGVESPGVSVLAGIARAAWATGPRWRREPRHTPEVVEPPRVRRDETERAMRVLGVLAAMPRRQRTVAVARFLDGRSPGEIADGLGVRPSTVTALAERARPPLSRAVPRAPGATGEALLSGRPATSADAALTRLLDDTETWLRRGIEADGASLRNLDRVLREGEAP